MTKEEWTSKTTRTDTLGMAFTTIERLEKTNEELVRLLVYNIETNCTLCGSICCNICQLTTHKANLETILNKPWNEIKEMT